MVENADSMSRGIEQLVMALPEKYQPIYGHPDLSAGCSRACEDRLPTIVDVALLLQRELGRQIRVLDLGSAQGFFSLSLAQQGCTVVGVDYLRQNVELSEGLAGESGNSGARFVHGSIEDYVQRLQPGQFDLVLGLSVFHHLVHTSGIGHTVEIIQRISDCIPMGIYELAVREEPLYWAPSQPERPGHLLAPYAFVRRMSEQVTHLSRISRPLFVASSRYWWVGDDFRAFTGMRVESHVNAMGSHQGTRRYFFSDGLMLKKMSLEHDQLRAANLLEYENELAYLTGVGKTIGAPGLLQHLRDDADVWLLREVVPGQLLSEMMEQQVPYSHELVLEQIVGQLVSLEAAGLYHNDVRCWNIVVGSDGDATLIDYGAISPVRSDCVWPEDLLLAFLITTREVMHGQLKRSYPVRRPLMDIGLLPQRYRAAFFSLLSRPRSEWTFAGLQAALQLPIGSVEDPSWALVLAKGEKALLQYEAALEHLQADSVDVRRRLDESLENANSWFLRASECEHIASKLASQSEDIASKLVSQSETYSAGKQEMESQLQDLKENCDAINEDLRRKHLEVEVTLSELQVARDELSDVRNELGTAHADLDSMNSNLSSLQAELTGVRSNLGRVNHGLGVAETDLEVARMDLARAREQLEVVTRGELEEVRRELEGVRAELAASLSNAHHWFLIATDARARNEALSSSKSWRWTKPLRFSARLVKFPAMSTRRILAAAIRRVLARPITAQLVGGAAKMVPGLHPRLRLFALNRQIISEPALIDQIGVASVVGDASVVAGKDSDPEIEVLKLSQRGRGIYGKLLRSEIKGKV